MFTLLADALFTRTLSRRGSNLPDHLKDHADRHVSRAARRDRPMVHPHNPYRDLW